MTELSELERQKEIQQALKLIQSENPRDRSTAVEQLGHLQGGLNALKIATSDRNGYVRAAAAKALVYFPVEEVSLYLGDLLWDTNPFVRSASIRSLGRVQARTYVDHIMDFLHDSNPHIRASVLRALSDLQVPEAPEALVYALNDTHRKVRLDAARGLRQLAEPQTLPMMQEVLIEMMRQPRLDLPFLNTLIQAIANCGSSKQTGPLLVRLLQEAVGCRTVAARALRPLCYEPARPAFVRALTDQNPNLRLAALQALAELGIKPSLPSIRPLLADEDSRVQRFTCKIIASANDMEALPLLREMAFSPNPFLRPRAIESVAILDPLGSQDLFIQLLRDNNLTVRGAAIEALIPDAKQKKVHEALKRALEEEVSDWLRERLMSVLSHQ